MPKKESDKLRLISKFLNKESFEKFDSLSNIDEIINLPITAFKFFKEADAKLLDSLFSIKNIGQFAYIDQYKPFEDLCKYDKSKKAKIDEILQINPDIEDKLKKAITISRAIHKIKKESISFVKKEQKIIVVGLSNAGKTTILKKFGGNIGIKDLAKLKPTKGVERQEIITSDMALTIWDFGGQEDYRSKYLQNPDKYFLSVDLVIYVIDLQDPEKYEESIDYFDKIIDILDRLEQHPYVLIFLHKYDPDLHEKDEILLNIELIKDMIKEVFINKKIDYDIYLSSIYSLIANEPKFSKYLKTTMEQTATLTDHKLEGMSTILETTLNGIIRLSESVLNQYNDLDVRLRTIESKLSIPVGAEKGEGKKSISLFTSEIPSPEYSTKLPTPFLVSSSSTENQKTSEPQIIEKNLRVTVLQELKELFAKRKA